MNKKWIMAVGLLVIVSVIGLMGCDSGSNNTGDIETLNISSQQEGIWVSGQGKVSAVPDIAVLSLGIEAQAENVAEAKAQADEAMQKIEKALDDNGIDEKDIQTQYYSIRKVTKWDRDKEEEVVTGYMVTDTVTVKVRDIDKTADVIDAVTDAGGDFIRINNISFDIDDTTDYYKEAREEAMKQAKEKAEQLADLADVTLGNPTYISEGSSYSTVKRSYVDYDEAIAVPEEAGGASISPGEMELTLTVQVTYAIK